MPRIRFSKVLFEMYRARLFFTSKHTTTSFSKSFQFTNKSSTNISTAPNTFCKRKVDETLRGNSSNLQITRREYFLNVVRYFLL